jgi:hypothetical protein
MMVIYIATFLTFLIAFFGLSIGMIFSDIKIKGHCGSPSLDTGCGGDSDQHEEGCSTDAYGNKINRCVTCDCEF